MDKCIEILENELLKLDIERDVVKKNIDSWRYGNGLEELQTDYFKINIVINWLGKLINELKKDE